MLDDHMDQGVEKYLDIIQEEAAAQDIELDTELAVEFAEELFLNELDEETFEELIRRIEDSGRFEPTLGPDEVKPTFGPEPLEEDDEIVEDPPDSGLEDLPDPEEDVF